MEQTPEKLARAAERGLTAYSSGTGPIVLWTHGFGDNCAIWDTRSADLAESGFTSLVWDLRGHGGSAAPHREDSYTRELVLDDIENLLDGREAVLGGHSFGGYVSLAYALRRPAQIRGLILFATGPGFRDPRGREKWNRYVHESVGNFDVPAEAAGMLVQQDSSVIDGLPTINVPILQIVGERDKMFRAGVEVIDKEIGGPCTTLVVEDAGHGVHRSSRPVVGEAIAGYLTSVAWSSS